MAIALFWIGSLVLYAVTQTDAETADRVARHTAGTHSDLVSTAKVTALVKRSDHPTTRVRLPVVTSGTSGRAAIPPDSGIGTNRRRAVAADTPPVIRSKPGLADNPSKRTLQTKTPRVTMPSPIPTRPAHTRQVWVTGYSLYGTTASGVPAGPGICAVDPYVIPLGTHITIAGVGSCVAADTGPSVTGAHIDVWVPDYQTALALTGRYAASW
ncbi:MAG: 3D domain-containing protein [Chloroflexota bacterium]